ncbi:hypothetical protein [Chryseobacterium sp. 2R14A]|uniref:hypothetical protein n=1 Tax=Chryseobacterium sp. 2R14A TaxID=3380353 RepID=UPI003CEF2F96
MFGGGGNPSTGGGSEGNNNNPPPTCENPVLQNPQNPDLNSSENPCGTGVPTQPNLPLPNKETPCKILKDNDAIPELKHKMDSLKLRVTQANPDKHETLVVITKEEPSGELIYNTYVAPTSGNGYMGVSGQGTNNDVADIHNHPPNTIPIFAFGDIVNIYDSYKFLYPNRKQVFVSYLVNFNGTTYAIKINDTTALDALFAGMNIGTATTTKAQRKLANEKVEAIFKKHGMDNEKTYNQADAEKLFMDVINNPIIGAGSGVHIYRKDNDGWGKLNMDSNGNITKENCPL